MRIKQYSVKQWMTNNQKGKLERVVEIETENTTIISKRQMQSNTKREVFSDNHLD